MNTFLMNIVGRFKGYYRIRFVIYDSERFFNVMSAKKISIWNITQREGKIFFNIRGEDMPHLREVADMFGVNIVITEKFGAVRLKSAIKRYRFQLLFLIAGVCIMYMMSSHIWQVNIYGARLTDVNSLSSFIYEQGYHSGIDKSKIDKSDIEIKIKKNFPYVTEVITNIDGIKLNITVYESEAPILVVDKATPVDIVALKDCVIDELVVYNGVAKVSAGDSVKKGDVLISGRIEYEYKDIKGTKNIHATGKTLSYEKVFYDNICIDLYVPNTGSDYISEKKIHIFKKTFTLSSFVEKKEDYFMTKTENMHFSIGWVNLPILYDEIRWYNKDVCHLKDESEIYDEIYDALSGNIPAGYTIKSFSYMLVSEENGVGVFSVEAQCAVNVGIEREITD